MKTIKAVPFIAIALLTAACNSNPTQNTAIDTKRSEKDSTFNICFSSMVKKDTVLLNAHMSGDSVTGSLGYKLYEKDQNNGSLLAKMYGDTLRGMYTFMSEGKESVREVIFIKKDTVLIEGYGPLKEVDGKTVFEDAANIKFNGIVLTEAPCK
ncbi:hypothetical protein DSL64_13380 [Dyadobacter luteus]|jgi:hypothetical protein|uniref:Uncharacterized protein n=1 Tax=Dyadobacter luteus TaxID=2259619 RepID=A0A3D8YBM8_9BACT|nr:hypothetical protein [Dyadobacter luteus]REA60888.1 hypothetical protein DSL64_13380 [Dyadobacter luteus]